MADVFISYSRRDGAFVRGLHSFLTEGGRDVWVDWEDIPPASQWAQDIDESIDAAESVVFVVSGSSLASEYCLLELRHAQERGKRIVPLACDGADPGAAPEGLRQLNWIWCRDGDDRDEAFAKLTRALDTDLEWAKAHTRLLVRAVEWEARQDGSLLLRGRDLEDAAQQLAANAGKEPVPTELQQRYVLASRRATAKRQRIVLGGVSFALVVSVALGVLALLQRNDARRATRAATSVALASAANDRVATKPDQALLLALAAYSSSPSAEARNAAVTALQAARKSEVAEFVHGDAAVRSVAFAPDGRTLAVGGADGVARLWDVRTREAIAELTAGGSRAVVSVGFARSGRTVAVGSADGTVRLWDVESRERVGRVFSADRAILVAAVSADAATLAAADGAGHVWLWDARSGRARRLAGPNGGHAVLAFSRDGRILAAAGNDVANVEEGAPGGVRLWDVASGRTLGDLPSNDGVEGLAFAADGATLATGGYVDSSRYDPSGSYGEVVLWDVRRLARVGIVKSRAFVHSVAFAPDGRRVAAGRSDGSIRLAAPKEGRWVGAPLRALRDVTSLAFSRDGHTIAAASAGDTTVEVWDLRRRARFGRPIGAEDDALDSVAFSPDGRTVAAAGGYGNAVHLVSVASETSRVPQWLRRDESAAQVAFSRDGSMLAVRDDDASVQLWDLRSHRRAGRLPAHSDETLGALAFDPAGDVLAAGGDDGTLRFWDVRHRTRGGTLHTRGVLAATFVDGGRTLVTAGGEGFVELWDVARLKAREPRLRPVRNPTSVLFSADGRTVAFGDIEGTVWLWDLRRRAPAAELPLGAGRGGPGLALSADGRTLAVVAESGGIQLWDVRARRPLGQPLPGENGAGVAFSPDGRVLASAGGAVRLWKGILWRDLVDLRAQVCGLVAGDLSKAEWAAIVPGIPYRATCSG